MKRLSPLMLAGTGSDVGKSLIATGLCRIFLQDGYNPAPFKAQNMALNSYATPDGKEIGRAQAVQAEAAGIECHTDMNPILLKPSGELTSQVVLNGVPAGNRDAYQYFREDGKEELRKIAHASFRRLNERYNPIVMEGAGSISELNLRSGDIVNMSMAEYAKAKVILVADIDRGGVFASVFGSIKLLPHHHQDMIKGVIINKFRGDLRLFDHGKKILEEITGKPVLGVVPLAGHFHIDEEDSVALQNKNSCIDGKKVNVCVVLLKHISNFTDFNYLENHPDVNLFYSRNPEEMQDADIIILPGSKNTIADLLYLRKKGLAKAIVKARNNGKTVIGICGGYQMMGREVADPMGIEGESATLPGLGLLPVSTVINKEKTTRQVEFRFMDSPCVCHGYEIHMGETHSDNPFNIIDGGIPDGCMADEKCFGTYIHGILDNEPIVKFILDPYLGSSHERSFNWQEYKERQYDLLAEWLRQHINIDEIYKIMRNDD